MGPLIFTGKAGDGMAKRHRSLLLLALAAVLLWLVHGFFVSRYGLTVNHQQLSLPRLEAPVRLAVLSDLHGLEFGEGNRTLIQKTAEQQPDLIFLLGDMLNDTSPDARAVMELVSSLTETASVYFAWGNHELDYSASPLEEELTAAGAAVLNRSYADITANGAALRLGGLYDYAFALDDFNTCDPGRMDPEVWRFLTEFQDTDRCRLMLSHRPDSFIFGEAAETWGVELVVCGHTHGGQVVLPALGGLFGGDQGFFPEYVHGIYEKDGLSLAVTSGLGSQPGRFPRFRNPPEIMILDLMPES